MTYDLHHVLKSLDAQMCELREENARLKEQIEFHESFTQDLQETVDRYESKNVELKAENAKLAEENGKLKQIHQLRDFMVDDYLKIKKLDENVRSKIKNFVYVINNKVDVTATEYNQAINELKLLESLYNE